MKSEIFNLIILDESGSMNCVRENAISGCNETLSTIRAAQKNFVETQTHYVSIFAFQGDGSRPSRYIIKNMPIDKVKRIKSKDYVPEGMTPLYDAIGSTLTDLKAVTKDLPMAIGNVTIITDGYENASTHYSHNQVVKMIDAVKECGWSVNFIGANINVESTLRDLHIDSGLKFVQDEDGMHEMFAKEKSAREKWLAKANECLKYAAYDSNNPEVIERIRERLKRSAKRYFED